MKVSHTVKGRPGAAPRASTTVTRKAFTDLLGLPADASNDQVFAAVDAKLAARRTTDADDALYQAAFGH